MTFDEMIGQDVVVKILKASVRRKRYESAYLFTGPSGVGKTTAGRILSKGVLCDSPVDGNPCGKCESCLLFAQEKHFGYKELDAASVGGKDDMVKLRDDAAFESLAKKKIILIDECHDISKQGQDALLKQVEQCPEHLIYIFCTTDPESMKDTLRARCMEFQISKVDVHLVVGRLKEICDKEKIAYEEAALKTIAEQADGHVRNAINKLSEISYLGSVSEENLKSVSHDYEDEACRIVCCLGSNLHEAISICKRVSAFISPIELYNVMISLLSDASKLLYGYEDFTEHRKGLLVRLKAAHGFTLVEFLNYLMHRDRHVDKIGLQSDIVLLHYKFSTNSFIPQTQKIVQVAAEQPPQNIPSVSKEGVPDAAPQALSFSQLSKMSIKDRSKVLREQRQNQKTEKKEETERVPAEWPLPKEERPGENSFDDEALTPQEFSLNLAGGRGAGI